jgi:hypothetical protein
MKCPADLVLGCDNTVKCKCGFCITHCICEYLATEQGKKDTEDIERAIKEYKDLLTVKKP